MKCGCKLMSIDDYLCNYIRVNFGHSLGGVVL
jgi:hypothetical protein